MDSFVDFAHNQLLILTRFRCRDAMWHLVNNFAVMKNAYGEFLFMNKFHIYVRDFILLQNKRCGMQKHC